MKLRYLLLSGMIFLTGACGNPEYLVGDFDKNGHKDLMKVHGKDLTFYLNQGNKKFKKKEYKLHWMDKQYGKNIDYKIYADYLKEDEK